MTLTSHLQLVACFRLGKDSAPDEGACRPLTVACHPTKERAPRGRPFGGQGEPYACPIKFSIATVASDSSLSNRCPQTISCSRLSPRKRVCGPGGSRELRFSAPPRRLIRIRAIPRQRFFLLPSFRARPGAGAFPTTGIPAARTSTPRAFREPRDPVRRAAGPAKQ